MNKTNRAYGEAINEEAMEEVKMLSKIDAMSDMGKPREPAAKSLSQ